jgi:hypothetical protein
VFGLALAAARFRRGPIVTERLGATRFAASCPHRAQSRGPSEYGEPKLPRQAFSASVVWRTFFNSLKSVAHRLVIQADFSPDPNVR